MKGEGRVGNMEHIHGHGMERTKNFEVKVREARDSIIRVNI